MAGQGAMLKIGAARSAAKGAGHEMGCGGGGSKPSVPTEGRTIGESQKGNSSSAGDVSPKSGKSKAKHMY